MKYLFFTVLFLGGCGVTPIPTSLEDYDEERVAREAKKLGMRPVDYLHYANNQHKKPKWEGGVANDGSFEPKYEIRLQNDLDNESLYFSPSLREAKEYIKEYGMFHQDLFIYEVEGGEVVEIYE